MSRPYQNLRPARDICEGCHTPARFVGEKLLVKSTFADDEKNTETQSVVVLHLGGRDSLSHLTGIHGVHLGHIEYVATDATRTSHSLGQPSAIADGSETVFTTLAATKGVQPKGERRVMDCIDCHNRAAHTFVTAEDALNRSMAEGAVSPELPWVHKEGLAAAQGRTTPPQEEARPKSRSSSRPSIARSTPSSRRQRPPSQSRGRSNWLPLYNQNVFPYMKVTWGTHPNHIGHMSYPGCFRCHDGGHHAKDGKPASRRTAPPATTCSLSTKPNPRSSPTSAFNNPPYWLQSNLEPGGLLARALLSCVSSRLGLRNPLFAHTSALYNRGDKAILESLPSCRLRPALLQCGCSLGFAQKRGTWPTKKSFGLPPAAIVLASLVASFLFLIMAVSAAASQLPAGSAPSRIVGDWRNSSPVLVPGSKPAALRIEGGEVAAEPDARLERVLLLLSPSVGQQKELDKTLEKLLDPSSPLYHQWFSASEYAAAFANSADDVATVSEWLQNEGLEVAPIPSGRGWIEFSGSVAQVEHAFRTRVVAETSATGVRFKLGGDIYVPAALAPVIAGLGSLDGVVAESALTKPEPIELQPSETSALSAAKDGFRSDAVSAILHLDSVHATGAKGAGQTIGIAARSDVNQGDVAAFRSRLGLAASALQVIPAGANPGLTADQAESTLVASWAGAAAPDAHVVLVPAATTTATDGLDLSMAALVDRQLAQTVVVGYSACEASLSPAHSAFYAALFRQAAAEGISVIAAAGDSGAAACRSEGEAVPSPLDMA